MTATAGGAGPAAGRRVLFLEHSRTLMGGQVSCLNIARILLGRGAAATLVYPPGGSTEDGARRMLGDAADHVAGPHIALNDRNKTWRDYLRMLGHVAAAARWAPLVRRHDVVYVSSARWFLQAWLLSRLVRRRFVYHVRVVPSPLECRLIRMIANSRGTHRVVVNTEFVLRRMVGMQPALDGHPRVELLRTPVFPPFDTLPFEDRISEAPESAPLVCAVIGRLVPSKGQDALLTVAPEVPGVRFVVIGAPHPDFPDYEAALRDDTPDSVELYGESRDVPATLREIGAQLSLVPSRWEEPFGLVAVESVACSCLTVVRRRGGLGDIGDVLELPRFEEDGELAVLLRELAARPRAALAEEARREHAALSTRYALSEFAESVSRICLD